MKLCVITATRGISVHLNETVGSVSALGMGTRHVLVCPASAEVVLARRFPSSEIVVEPAGGLYAALNAGLARIRDDEAFTWLNDDDVVCVEGFKSAAARLAGSAAVGVVYGRVGLMDEAGRRLGELPMAHRADDLSSLLAGGIMPLAQPGTLMRGSVAKRIGDFDPTYRLAGDLDYFVRALRAGVGFAFVDAEVARFRLRAGQLSKDEPAVADEYARAVAGLAAQASAAARWRFRWDNRGVYLERVRRHGFVRMQTLYRHG